MSSPDLSTTDPLRNASASEVAGRFADLSACMYRGYCTGLIMLDLPIFAKMEHLSKRLYDYAFSLVVEGIPGFFTRPDHSTSLNTPRAMESMGQLASLLESRAHDLEVCRLANGTELALAKYLRFAEKYTEMLLEMGPESFVYVETSTVPDEAVVDILEPRPISEKALPTEATTEAPEPKAISGKAPGRTSTVDSLTGVQHTEMPRDVWSARVEVQKLSNSLLPLHPEITVQASEPLPMSEKARGKMRAVESPARVRDVDTNDAGKAGQTLSNGHCAEFRYTVAEPVTAHLHGSNKAETQPQEQHAGPSHAKVDAQMCLDLPAQASSGFSSGATSPHDLRPTPYNAEHAPHPLQGSRLSSRSGAADNDASAKLHTPPGKLLYAVPEACTTVQIGHSTSETFQACHYVDASSLSFSGIKTLKLVHPFCAQEIHELDFEVLRYIASVLHQRAVTHYAHGDERERAAKRAEKESHRLVRREIGIRDWDIKRARQQAAHQALSGHKAQEVGNQHSWPGHEARAADALKRSMKAASAPSSHITGTDESVPPDDSLSRRLQPDAPFQNAPAHYSIDVRVPSCAKGPKDIHVIWADDTSPDFPTSWRASRAQAARQSRKPSHRSVASELLRTTAPELRTQPNITSFWVSQQEQAAATAAGPDAVRTANGSYNGGQLPPVLGLRSHGSSMEQLHAQLSALKDRIANTQPQSSPRPEISVYVPPQEPEIPGSWPNMPRSPLQGSPSSIQGPHDGWECAITPCGLGTSEHEAQAVVADAAEEETAAEEPTTGEPVATKTVVVEPKQGNPEDSCAPRESVSTMPTIVQPSPRRTQAQAEVLQWAKDKNLFEGRSSPPFVAYTNIADGKKYVLGTANGKPEALDGSTLKLEVNKIEPPEAKSVFTLLTAGPSNSPAQEPASLVKEPTESCSQPEPKPQQGADGRKFYRDTNPDGKRYNLYTPAGKGKPELLFEYDARAPSLPNERIHFPFLGSHHQPFALRSSRGRQVIGKQRTGQHGITGLIERYHDWDDYGYSAEDQLKASQTNASSEAGCSTRDRPNFEPKK